MAVFRGQAVMEATDTVFLCLLQATPDAYTDGGRSKVLWFAAGRKIRTVFEVVFRDFLREQGAVAGFCVFFSSFPPPRCQASMLPSCPGSLNSHQLGFSSDANNKQNIVYLYFTLFHVQPCNA